MSYVLFVAGQVLSAVGKATVAGATDPSGNQAAVGGGGNDDIAKLLAALQGSTPETMDPSGGLTGQMSMGDLTARLNSGLEQSPLGQEQIDNYAGLRNRVNSLGIDVPQTSGGLDARYGAYQSASQNPFGGLSTQAPKAAESGFDWQKLLGGLGSFFGG